MSRSSNRGRRRRGQRRPEAAGAAPQPEIRHFPLGLLSEQNGSAPKQRAMPAREMGEGELRVGCPMLTRTKMAIPTLGGRHVPRCSLAWAIHTEDEAVFCMLTEDSAECWQAHPERVPILESLLTGEANAAD